jgi:acylphosphatase
MSDEVAVRVVIRGRVQGVWYRGWTVAEATRRGLRGWVRNRRDGTVEALLAGPRDKVEAMIDACRDGPPAARVDAVERFTADAAAVHGFDQRPTE